MKQQIDKQQIDDYRSAAKEFAASPETFIPTAVGALASRMLDILDEVERLQGLLDRAVEDLKSCVGEHGRCQFCISYMPKRTTLECRFRGMLHTETCPDWQWRGFSEREGG